MLYPCGEEAHLGDQVRLGQTELGEVVCSVDTGEFSKDYPRREWGGLKQGILVAFDNLGLIHYTRPEKTLQLVSRGRRLDGREEG